MDRLAIYMSIFFFFTQFSLEFPGIFRMHIPELSFRIESKHTFHSCLDKAMAERNCKTVVYL